MDILRHVRSIDLLRNRQVTKKKSSRAETAGARAGSPTQDRVSALGGELQQPFHCAPRHRKWRDHHTIHTGARSDFFSLSKGIDPDPEVEAHFGLELGLRVMLAQVYDGYCAVSLRRHRRRWRTTQVDECISLAKTVV